MNIQKFKNDLESTLFKELLQFVGAATTENIVNQMQSVVTRVFAEQLKKSDIYTQEVLLEAFNLKPHVKITGNMVDIVWRGE